MRIETRPEEPAVPRPPCRRGPMRIALALALALASTSRPASFAGAAESGGSNDAEDPAVAMARVLRSAVAQSEAGGSGGDAALAAVARAYPLIADHVAAIRLAARLETRDAAKTAALAHEILEQHDGSVIRDELEELAGAAFAGAGEADAAREARERALGSTRNRERAARLRLLLGQDAEQQGDVARASRFYLALWRDRPTSGRAAEAAARLDALEAANGAPLRSAADWLERGRRLGRSGANEEALVALDSALALGLDAVASEEARLERAHTFFRLRRYPEAELAFGALTLDEARLHRARAIARQGDVARAVAALLALADESGSDRRATAAEARWLAATLLDDEPDGRQRARALFRRVAASADAPTRVAPALWRLGWSAFRDESSDDARAEFARLATAASDPIDRLQAQYWSARAAGQGGDPDTERTELTRLASDHPLTYYGWRASARVSGAGVEARRGRAPDEPRRLGSDALLRARVLLGAGLHGRASDEVRRLTRRGSSSASDRLALAGLLAEANEPHAAQHLALVAFGTSPTTLPEPSEVGHWRLLWPRAFLSDVNAFAAPEQGVPAALIWSIMREESGYRPDVVSPAGARGLLQIMPSTGARLAREAQLDRFDPQDLFEPSLNVRLGAFYLGVLMRRFEGRASAAIGSYNAGPEAVARWLARTGGLPDDEWVEGIPYEQTRGYVKRVLRSVCAYELLP